MPRAHKHRRQVATAAFPSLDSPYERNVDAKASDTVAKLADDPRQDQGKETENDSDDGGAAVGARRVTFADTNDVVEAGEVNRQMQRLLATPRISGENAERTSFDPVSFLNEMQSVAQKDMEHKQLCLCFLSEYDDEEDLENNAVDIPVTCCKIEIHSQCKASLSISTATRVDRDSLGDDAIIRAFHLDLTSQAETPRIDVGPPPIPGLDAAPGGEAAVDDDDIANYGNVVFRHPTLAPNGVKFQLTEPRHVVWTDAANDSKKPPPPSKKANLAKTKGGQKQANNSQKQPDTSGGSKLSPLHLYVSFDYMSFTKIT